MIKSLFAEFMGTEIRLVVSKGWGIRRGLTAKEQDGVKGDF